MGVTSPGHVRGTTRPGGYARLSLLLPVLALLLGALCALLAPPAQAQTQTQTLLSATLKVDEANGKFGCSNYDDAQNDCSSASVLTDDDFLFQGIIYGVTVLRWDKTGKKLEWQVGNSPTDWKGLFGLLTLNVGGTSLAVSDAGTGNRHLEWPFDPDPDWTDGQSVALSLTGPALLPPPAPASLDATTPAPNTIRLFWSFSPSARTDRFVIEVSADGGTTWRHLATLTGGSHYSHTGLPGGTVRHYRVKARNIGGGVNADSAWSETASATALHASAPAKPTGIALEPVVNGVKLTWDDPNDATLGHEYRLASADNFGPWTAIPGSEVKRELGKLTYTVTGLSPFVSYAFQLRAVRGAVKGVELGTTLLGRQRPLGGGPPAGLTVPWDWTHLPVGPDGGPAFTDGESFRLLFMTVGERDATSNDMAEYNRFVQAGAPTAGTRALVSTLTVQAHENTATDTGAAVPIWWLGGDKVADNYADFWDGSWDSRVARSVHGDPAGGLVWTGSVASGRRELNRHAGAARVRYGWPARAGGAVSLDDAPATRRHRLYGLSPVITVKGAQPEPGPNAVRVVQGYRSDYGGRAHLLADSLRVSWNRFDGGFVCDYLVEWKSGDEEYGAERRMEVSGLAPTHATIGELEPGTAYTVRVRRSGGARYSPWFLMGEKTYTLPAEEAPAAPAPGLEWARVNGAELALRFDGVLDESSKPPAGAFPVSVAGAARGVWAVSVRQDLVTLTLAEPVSADEAVTVGYAPPSRGPRLRLSGGGADVAAFSGQAVTNDTPPGQPQRQSPPGTEGPLTARVEAAPSEHRGKGRFELRVAFGAPVTGRAKDAAIEVTGGTLARAARVDERKDLWELRVQPSGYGAVTVTLPATADCAASGAVCTADGRRLASALTHTVPGPVTVSVANARAKEGEDETLDFQVALSRAASAPVTVRYATRNGTAKKNKDYRQAKGTLVFAAGETSKTVSVALIDDAKDEGEETFTLLLTRATGAVIADGEATGTIENDDPMPQAWLARFGRTVATQAVDAVTERLEGGASSHVTLGGQQVSLDSPQGRAEAAAEIEAVAAALGAGPADRWPRDPWTRGGPSDDGAGPSSQTMTGRELLLGSAFHLQSQGVAGGPAFAAWGRVATGGFDGEEDGVTMDGTVTTGFLGADVSSGRWLAGAAVALSEGEGSFALSGAAAGESAFDQGEIESSLTSVLPYARLELNERVSAWAMAGYGTGELVLTEKNAAAGKNPAVTERHKADLTMTMGALGGRGTLVDAPEGGGFALALRGDAFWVRTESDATEGMEGATADATRLRLILDASRPFALAGGGTLTPSFEVGLRHDGGDAETGTGVELGAGLAWADPASGVSAELRGRWLAAHESGAYEEWGASGSVRIDPGERGRGLSLTLVPTVGAAGSGTGNLWSAADARGFGSPSGTFEAEQRLDAEVSYGLAMFGERFTGTPHAGLGLSDTARELRLGWRLAPADGGDFELHLDAARRDSVGDVPEHRVGFGLTARW
ncbi:MAG: SwmB domain-containing protein [Alphaproteobacteria bacterium]|nr:SwmB domain-containing protein [Alphaproteobacteria bacterium]